MAGNPNHGLKVKWQLEQVAGKNLLFLKPDRWYPDATFHSMSGHFIVNSQSRLMPRQKPLVLWILGIILYFWIPDLLWNPVVTINSRFGYSHGQLPLLIYAQTRFIIHMLIRVTNYFGFPEGYVWASQMLRHPQNLMVCSFIWEREGCSGIDMLYRYWHLMSKDARVMVLGSMTTAHAQWTTESLYKLLFHRMHVLLGLVWERVTWSFNRTFKPLSHPTDLPACLTEFGTQLL